MREFNLEKALAGHPVITRSGMDVTGLHRFDDALTNMNVIGVSLGVIHQWNEKGKLLSDRDSAFDLFMKVVKKPYTIITAKDRYHFLSSKLFGEVDTYELLVVLKRWKDMGYTDIQVHVIEREE